MMRLVKIAVVLIVGMFAAGCASEQVGDELTDHAALVAALEGSGATVEPAGEIVPEDSVFPVSTRIIDVNGQSVQVFEFDDPAAAGAAAATVAESGVIVGTATYEWIATPHFYRLGNLIVLYVGDDAATQTLLADTLGEEFAGGGPAMSPPSP
jgi:hypothetical protein